MTKGFLAAVVAVIGVLLAAPLSVAQQAAPTGAPPTAEDSGAAKADAVLRTMSEFLKAQKSLRIQAHTLFDERASGLKSKRTVRTNVAVVRPDKLHFRTVFDGGAVREGWYDGKNFTVAAPENKTYVSVPFEGSVDDVLDSLQERLGVNFPITDVLYADVYEAQAPFIVTAAHLGERMIEDDRLDHLSFEGIGADWQLWVEQGERPVPRRLIVHYVRIAGQPETVVTFDKWSFDAIEASEFEPTIPDDWTRVDPPAR